MKLNFPKFLIELDSWLERYLDEKIIDGSEKSEDSDIENKKLQ